MWYVRAVYTYVFTCGLFEGEEEVLSWVEGVTDDFVKVDSVYGESSGWEGTAQGLDPEDLLLKLSDGFLCYPVFVHVLQVFYLECNGR